MAVPDLPRTPGKMLLAFALLMGAVAAFTVVDFQRRDQLEVIVEKVDEIEPPSAENPDAGGD